MPSGDGAINGREINWFAINGGINAAVVEADMSLQIAQTAALVRANALTATGGLTFQSTLSEIIRAKVVVHNGSWTFSSALTQIIRTRELNTAEAVTQFEMSETVDVVPAMTSDQIMAFLSEAQVDHVFFSHWLPGTRIGVPPENRGMRVEGDNRHFMVEPDPDELVEQKHRELVS